MYAVHAATGIVSAGAPLKRRRVRRVSGHYRADLSAGAARRVGCVEAHHAPDLGAAGHRRPYSIAEFAPVPTASEVASVLAAMEQADRTGWMRCDPDTLEPTGEIVDGTGTVVRRFDPATEEPWP